MTTNSKNAISQMSITELENLLHDIESCEYFMTKINNIQNSINNLRQPYTEFSNKLCNEMSNINNNVNNSISYISKYFRKYGIDDDNIDYIDEIVQQQLKSKLSIEVRRLFYLNDDVYNNISQYIDAYFEQYDICKKVGNRVELITQWINTMQYHHMQLKNEK